MVEADVIETVERLAESGTWPTLVAGDIQDAVDRARVTDVGGNPPENQPTVAAWQAETTYLAGGLVVGDGRFWKAIVAGLSADTEPAWPTISGAPTGTTVDDGTVVWRDNGARWAGAWDVDWAVAAAWLLKAAKVAGAHNFATDGQVFDRAQVHRHCLEQYARYIRQHGPVVA